MHFGDRATHLYSNSTYFLIRSVTLPVNFSNIQDPVNKRYYIGMFVLTPVRAMLFLLFVYYLVRWASIDASPVPPADNRSLAPNHCTDISHCRSIWDIIWSCLITVLSSTWVALHPNVPSSKKRVANGWIEKYIRNPLLSFAEHRLPLFICALLVPEYVLAWAVRQFLSARKISNQGKGEYETFG